VVQVLASEHGDWSCAGSPVALRAFELLLLREIGLLPLLDAQTLTLEPLAPEGRYCLVPEGGLREFHDDDRASLRGANGKPAGRAGRGRCYTALSVPARQRGRSNSVAPAIARAAAIPLRQPRRCARARS
jgi:hypothetical protein